MRNEHNLDLISIHALRGEGDAGVGVLHRRHIRFLSTPSAGRATGVAQTVHDLDKISIHALRGEGDKPYACLLS